MKFSFAKMRPFLYSLAVTLGLTAWSSSEPGRTFDYHFSAPIVFGLRDKAGKAPPAAENVKAIAFDDFSAAHLKTLSLSLEQWRILLQGVAAQNPSLIFIDSFSDDIEQDPAEIATFVKAVRELSAPVIVGASLQTVPIVDRLPHTGFRKDDFNWSIPVPASIDLVPNWIPKVNDIAFSGHPSVSSAFTHFGHIAKPLFGKVAPSLRIGSETLLAHFGLYGAGRPTVGKKGLTSGTHAISLDDKGLMAINFVPLDRLLKGMMNLRYCLYNSLRGQPINNLNPGDIVVILTGMYTGHGDWNLSPYGIVPAGTVALNIVHTAVTGRWLKTIPFEWVAIITFGLLGFFLAKLLKSNRFWITLSITSIAIVSIGIGAFVYFDFIMPWLYSSLTFSITAVVRYAQKLLAADKDQWRLKHELLTAKTVQNQLFPPTEKIEGQVSIAARYEPAAECGGDFWDQFHLSDGRQFITIGDAVGHGASAALVAAAANACCLSLARLKESGAILEFSPSSILKHLNTVLFRSFKGEVTMTCFVAAIDSARGSLTYANAGHCFPLHIPLPPGNSGTAPGKIKLLSAKGDPLGVSAATVFPDKEVRIQPGEQIFFYSDGITEAWGPDKTQYGSKRLYQFATKNSTATPMDFINSLMDSVRLFQNSVPQGDDMTSVLVAIRGPA